MASSSNSLQQQFATMRQSLFDKEILDEQFVQVEQLEDEESPNFVKELISIYFDDSTALIDTIEEALEGTIVDLINLDECLSRLKGCSLSLGANKVKIEVDQARECLEPFDMKRLKTVFKRVKQEHSILKNKLETYMELRQQVGPAKPQ